MASNISSNPEYIEILNFLIEKTKDAKSSMNVTHLAEEFRTNSGCSQGVLCLLQKIYKFRSKIHQMDSISTGTKVKMLFALGGAVDMDFLNELRKDAVVEVDGKNRITKYKANDGSEELIGDHSLSAKLKETWQQKKILTPRSTKRAAAEMSSSSKRTAMKLEAHAPDGSASIPESRAREVVRRFSPQPPTPRIQQHRQSKREGMTPETPRAPAPVFRAVGAARTSFPIKTESEADEAYTPQIKFLEAIQSLVLNLELPVLSALQTKIEEKLRESPNTQIPNEEMILAMEVLVTKITNYSVSNLSENVDSVTLSNFLCYLKAAILNSKLEGLEALLEKIKGRINNPSLKFKNIPVEEIASALRTALDVVGI